MDRQQPDIHPLQPQPQARARIQRDPQRWLAHLIDEQGKTIATQQQIVPRCELHSEARRARDGIVRRPLHLRNRHAA
jgi:hypothetical protein